MFVAVFRPVLLSFISFTVFYMFLARNPLRHSHRGRYRAGNYCMFHVSWRAATYKSSGPIENPSSIRCFFIWLPRTCATTWTRALCGTILGQYTQTTCALHPLMALGHGHVVGPYLDNMPRHLVHYTHSWRTRTPFSFSIHFLTSSQPARPFSEDTTTHWGP